MTWEPRAAPVPPVRRRGKLSAVGKLVDRTIKHAGERRGFSETRLLTRWAEVAGAEVAAICRPVKVGYPRHGLGAILTLLTTGAQAPMLQMRLPALRERVNACYGYAAIARIDITQTAPTGFADGRIDLADAAPVRREPDASAVACARDAAREVGDPSLRAALERLGANIISRTAPAGRPQDPEGRP